MGTVKQGKPPASSTSEEVLRRYSYAKEFRNRKRQNLWLLIARNVLILLASLAFFALYFHDSLPWWSLPLAIGMAVSHGYVAWRRPAPICPHCQKNIRYCPAVYCHVCGEPLHGARCERCGVNQSWTHGFGQASETSGNRQPIMYCPGCAVFLESDFRRWLGGGLE